LVAIVLDWAAPRDVGSASLMAPMDLNAFAEALRSLPDNAVNHGAVGGLIEVSNEPGGNICVINGDPVVPPDSLAKL